MPVRIEFVGKAKDPHISDRVPKRASLPVRMKKTSLPVGAVLAVGTGLAIGGPILFGRPNGPSVTLRPRRQSRGVSRAVWSRSHREPATGASRPRAFRNPKRPKNWPILPAAMTSDSTKFCGFQTAWLGYTPWVRARYLTLPTREGTVVVRIACDRGVHSESLGKRR